MAINQTDIAVAACADIVGAVNQILDGLDKLETIKEMLDGNGVVLANFDAEISAAEAIRHCSPATFTNIITACGPGIVAALKALYDGTPTEQGWNAMQKART